MGVKTVSSQADAVNPLGYEKEGKLLVGFAIPCIISMLVTSLYNIVDQIFIGQGVGLLGNAATNIAFPLSIACTAIALLLGIGSATNFSLQLGAGNEKRSAEYAGNGLCLMALFGTVLMAVTLLFLTPMLKFFGATPDVFLRRGLHSHHSAGVSVPHYEYRHEQVDSGRRQPALFHDVDAHRRTYQYGP